MARYSEKDKDKKTLAGTYAAPPPAPAGTYPAPPAAAPSAYGQTRTLDALEAEDSGGSCSLEVVVVDKASSAPIHKAKVTLSTTDFSQTLKTDQKGVVCWTHLSPGEYWVEVSSHHGYQTGPKREQVALTEREDAEIQIGLEPEQATLFVQAYYDAKRCGDPEGQIPIKSLRFDVYKGSQLLDSGKTGDDGTACLTFSQTGWVELRPKGKVRADGTTLMPAARDRLLVLLEPGKQSDVELAYVSGTASLTVEAVLASEDCDDEATSLSGVGLALYTKGANVPLRRAITTSRGIVFDDLAPDTYVINVTTPPGYQLEDPTQQEVSVVVHSDHHSQPLTLRFHKALCQVFGSILGAGSPFGWEGIGVVLRSADGKYVLRTTTGAQGEFLFTNVLPGSHHIELAESKVFYNQDEWVLASGCQPRQVIHAKPGARITTQPFLLELDKHTLTVRVLDTNGRPIPHTAFDVLAENGSLIGTFSTDKEGLRTIDVHQAGRYQVRWDQSDRLIYEAEVNSEAFIEMHARGSVFSHRPGPPTETTIDIPYPLITESPSMGGGSWAPSGPSSSTDLGQTVQEALRSVLNWRSAGFNGDAKGFVAALNQSFTITQTQGHTEFTWTPRSYAAVQSGLGALTGAQASIYTRAKVALDQITPLLAGLYPLLSDADPQNVEAIRAIVRSGVTELINEFGIEGGPRVLRADDLFRQLVGSVVQTNPENVGGQLKQLSDYFGLVRTNVNTIDEEQNLTNFLIIVDYILGLQQSWLTQRSSFTRGTNSNPFLGTQLVLVERSLAVVAESVQEVYMTLDSVFVGKEERQVVELSFSEYQPGEGNSSLFVSELLGWIDQVASNEGPQLIKDGGKQGVISFKDTIGRLAFLAGKALLQEQVSTPTGANLPKGYRTARVQNSLAELASHLKETSNLINPFH